MKTKYKFVAMCFIVILIFLGVLWLINIKCAREGLDTPTDPQLAAASEQQKSETVSKDDLESIKPENLNAGAAKVQGAVNGALEDLGVDPITLDPIVLTQVLSQLQGIIDRENAANTAKAAAAAQKAADITTTIDTTQSIYQGKTYFKGMKFGDGFCELNNTDPISLNSKCGALTAESCNQTDCCIFINGKKCVAGDATGPTFKTDNNGEDIDYAYYSYKNMCYGSCGKGISNAANPCSAYESTDTGISIQCLQRLWAETKCPNTRYITPTVVESLKDFSKSAILDQMKNAKAEPNYAKCYGGNPANWPPPCDRTKDSSAGLSSRCLTKLFKDVGCTNTAYTDVAMAKANELEPKSAMIAKFGLIHAGQDDTSLGTCYGLNQNNWPDPCIGAGGDQLSNSAKLFTNAVPLRCAKNIWKEVWGTSNADGIESIYSGPPSRHFPWTFGEYYKWLQATKPYANKLLFGLFYGMNPNNWPGVNKVFPDPCSSIQARSRVGDLSPQCIQRITDNLPRNNIKSATEVRDTLNAPGNANTPLYDFYWMISVKPTIWHFDNIGRDISYEYSNIHAHSQGGRLASWAEALEHIKNGSTYAPLLPGQNQWVAIEFNGKKDWMNVGNEYQTGTILEQSGWTTAKIDNIATDDGTGFHRYVLWLGY